MGPALAAVATLAAGLVLIGGAGLVVFGIGYGHDSLGDMAFYAGAIAVLIAIVVANALLAIALWRLRPAPRAARIIVMISMILAAILAVWSLILDPADSLWVVPPLLLYAGCSAGALYSLRGKEV